MTDRFLATLALACVAAAPQRLSIGYTAPDWLGVRGAMHDAIARGMAAGTIQTLPSWSHGFTVLGKPYSYNLLGTDPAAGPATTLIPTVLVPIRFTIPDGPNGVPLVLDATRTMADVIHSPIFTASRYDSGTLQFADAMLHAEFPLAPKGWHLKFLPAVAPTLDITAPPGTTQLLQAKSGKYVAVLNDQKVLNQPILDELRTKFSPQTYVVFVSYNWLPGYFGYHSAYLNQAGTAVTVFTYTSWLEGVGDVFNLPSPDADTLAHEIAETTHDAFSLSKTREWGDWFNQNKCFQPYIEVGDAVEDAPARVQNYQQKVRFDGGSKIFTLQTEAMLPWFERQYPSSAIHGAYSFPGETALLGPAPFDCAH